MKKQLLLFASIFFINTAFSQSCQEALNKLNRYLEKYNGGYYGPIAVKDGIIYIAEAGQRSTTTAKIEKIKLAIIENKDLYIQCINDEKCFYNNVRNLNSSSVCFSTYPKKESLFLLPLINDFLNSYNKEKGFSSETVNVIAKNNVSTSSSSVAITENNIAKNASKTTILTEKPAAQKEISKTYTCISGDCNNGYGTKNYDIGNSYTGQFKNRRPDGEGTEIYNGTTYKGQFKNGLKDGEGTSIEKNGTTFKGNWENGHRDGEGTETNPDGITLKGNWDHTHLTGNGIETLPNGYYKTGKFKHYNCCPDKPKYYTKDNIEISRDKYEGLKNQYSVKENAEKVLAAQPKCTSGDCQNGYGVIRYSDGTKYFGMCKNGSCEGLGYFVEPDVTTYKYDDKDGRDPYGGLYSLKQVPVVTPGKISYGEWINGVKTRSFNNLEEFSNEVNKRNGAYQYSDGLYSINKSNMDAEAKQQKAEDDAAERAYYNNQMKNVSITPSSSSSNETTVKTTTITKSGNEIIDFKTVPKQ